MIILDVRTLSRWVVKEDGDKVQLIPAVKVTDDPKSPYCQGKVSLPVRYFETKVKDGDYVNLE